jgi:3-deoxy-7-phosphoheptulonate synthase
LKGLFRNGGSRRELVMDVVVVMRSTASSAQKDAVNQRITDLGLQAHAAEGEFRTMISAHRFQGCHHRPAAGAVGGGGPGDCVTQPYRLASREFHEADTIIDIKGIRVGGPHVNVIAGPCAIESRELLFEVGQAVKDAGASILRGGAFKPRSSPYSFQGLGVEGLKLLKEAGEALNMPTITEVTDPRDVEVVAAVRRHLPDRRPQHAELQPAAGGWARPTRRCSSSAGWRRPSPNCSCRPSMCSARATIA